MSFEKSLLSLNQANIRVEFFGNNNAFEENNRFDYSLHDKYPDSGYFSYSFGSIEVNNQATVTIDMEGLSRSAESHNFANYGPTSNSLNETDSGGGSFHFMILMALGLFCIRRDSSK